MAAERGYFDALKLLVENDADVIDLTEPNNRHNLLIVASRFGRVDVCKYLVEEKNVNVNLKDKNGLNALQYATNHEIIKILRSKGAEFNAGKRSTKRPWKEI